MTRTKLATVGAAALLALAALGGCDRRSPPPPEANDTAAPAANLAEPVQPAEPLNIAAPADANAAAAALNPREAPAAPDAQTIDDADATGMTAHVRRDDAGGNATAP